MQGASGPASPTTEIGADYEVRFWILASVAQVVSWLDRLKMSLTVASGPARSMTHSGQRR